MEEKSVFSPRSLFHKKGLSPQRTSSFSRQPYELALQLNNTHGRVVQKKSIALGNSSFPLMRRSNSCYVDKTRCIRSVIESGNFAQVILRPRRFGKSLFMSTIRSFLSIDAMRPGDAALQKELFDGLGIMEDKSVCDQYMGKVPVLFLSLKDFFGQDFQYALASIANQIAITANSFSFLLDSPRLSPLEKRRLQDYINLNIAETVDNRMKAARFPSDMTTFLARHFGLPAMLLIDEYDVPLAKAAAGGYYKEMQGFMQKFFSVLKPENTPLVNNLPVLEKALLTGCLRVSKESIFTGVNNLSVNTVCTDNVNLAAAMGFTEGEVDALLRCYGLEFRKEDVRRWYDGYRFGSSEIYSPWDVLSFCKSSLESDDPKRLEPDNFWINTSSNDLIDEFLGFLSETDADRMQTLLNGGSIELKINEQLTYADLVLHQSDDFWTLLLFTGYLTTEKYLGDRVYRLRIPNEEIRQTFENRVAARFSSQNSSFAAHGVKLAEAAVCGNAPAMPAVLGPLLRNYVSVRDAATRAPAENYYHGFLSALLASAGNRIQDFKSNTEAGDGYADIVFSSGYNPDRIGVVIEIKRVARPEDLTGAVEDALKQIAHKNYAECLRKMRCRRYFAYGIAFCGKNCEVGGGTLKNA